MDNQTAFNVLLSLVSFLGAWVLYSIRGSIESLQKRDESLQKRDEELTEKMHQIEVLVTGKYVERDDMEKHLDKLGTAIFTKLDKIENKLDNKADK